MDQILNLVHNGRVHDGSTITTKGIIRVDGNGGVYVESMHDLVLIDGYNLSDMISGVPLSSLSPVSGVAGQTDNSTLSGDYQDLLQKHEELNISSAAQIKDLQKQLVDIKNSKEEALDNHQRELVQMNMDKNMEYLDLEFKLQQSQAKLAAALKDLKIEKEQRAADADKLKAVVHVEEMMDKDRELKDKMHTEEISRLCAELQKAQAELGSSKEAAIAASKPIVVKDSSRAKLKRLLSFKKIENYKSDETSTNVGVPDM